MAKSNWHQTFHSMFKILFRKTLRSPPQNEACARKQDQKACGALPLGTSPQPVVLIEATELHTRLLFSHQHCPACPSMLHAAALGPQAWV